MCCFSGPAKVGATRIFARGHAGARQTIAYAMAYSAARELALVLPIPVAPGSGDDAVTFIDLSGSRAFFAQLAAAWPQPQSRSFALAPAPAGHARALVVHEVGDFEASFVPTVSDFARLDARFRLATGVWDAVPLQRSYGFVVAKLRVSTAAQAIHPLAFEFPRRDPGRIFFPTLHVHDEQVHPVAAFDHEIYVQTSARLAQPWHESWSPLGEVVTDARARTVIDPAQKAWKQLIQGPRANEDLFVDAS